MGNSVEIIKETNSDNLFGSNLLDYLKDKYITDDSQNESSKLSCTQVPNKYYG